MNEYVDTRTCGQGDVTVRVLPAWGHAQLLRLIAALDGPVKEADLRVLAAGLVTVDRSLETVVMETCPVIDHEVDVTVQRTGPVSGIERWTCPVCGWEHEQEVHAGDYE